MITRCKPAAGVTDHGALTGLLDDDHPQYGAGGVTDHGELDGLSDDDHPQYGLLAATETVAALWTFDAGLQLAAGQSIKDSGGTARYTPATSSPENKLTGSLHVSGPHLKVGVLGPGIDSVLEATAPPAGVYFVLNLLKLSHLGTGMPMGGVFPTARGMFGLPIAIYPASIIGGSMYGLQFETKAGGGNTGLLNDMTAIRAGWGTFSFTGTISTGYGINLLTPDISGTHPASVPINYGIYIRAQHHTSIVDTYGLRIDDATTMSGFARLLEIGPATPYLRVVGGGAPGAALSNVWADFGGIGLRQLQVDAIDTAGAGFRAVRILN